GKAVHALRGIISDAEKASVIFMQAISEASSGHYIDFNLDDMKGLRILDEPLLTFRRVNPILEEPWLKRELGDGFNDYSMRVIRRLHQIDLAEKANLKRCHDIGIATGDRYVTDVDFPPAFDI